MALRDLRRGWHYQRLNLAVQSIHRHGHQLSETPYRALVAADAIFPF